MLLIAFDSTQQALRAEMLLEYAEIDIDICPTPKAITAGCALSIEFPKNNLNQVQQVIVEGDIVIRGIYQPTGENSFKELDGWKLGRES